jgi:hypothetical protein
MPGGTSPPSPVRSPAHSLRSPALSLRSPAPPLFPFSSPPFPFFDRLHPVRRGVWSCRGERREQRREGAAARRQVHRPCRLSRHGGLDPRRGQGSCSTPEMGRQEESYGGETRLEDTSSTAARFPASSSRTQQHLGSGVLAGKKVRVCTIFTIN